MLHVQEGFVADGIALNASKPSLADFHLAPMLHCFNQADEGAETMMAFLRFTTWLTEILA
ncbi:MAG: hypothetical protein AAGF53_00940 [Pseudomonadota bacterium]